MQLLYQCYYTKIHLTHFTYTSNMFMDEEK
jgi:hypothetical protein